MGRRARADGVGAGEKWRSFEEGLGCDMVFLIRTITAKELGAQGKKERERINAEVTEEPPRPGRGKRRERRERLSGLRRWQKGPSKPRSLRYGPQKARASSRDDNELRVSEMGSSGAGPLQGQEEPNSYRQRRLKSTGPSRLLSKIAASRVNKSGCATWERRPLQKAAATEPRKTSGLKA